MADPLLPPTPTVGDETAMLSPGLTIFFNLWKYVLVERPIGTACAKVVSIADSVGENLKCFYLSLPTYLRRVECRVKSINNQFNLFLSVVEE